MYPLLLDLYNEDCAHEIGKRRPPNSLLTHISKLDCNGEKRAEGEQFQEQKGVEPTIAGLPCCLAG